MHPFLIFEILEVFVWMSMFLNFGGWLFGKEIENFVLPVSFKRHAYALGTIIPWLKKRNFAV